MVYILEFHVPQWHDGESYNKILIIDADNFDAALSLGQRRLKDEISGPKEWQAEILRYLVITKNMGITDFTKQGSTVIKLPKCPCCKSNNTTRMDNDMIKCGSCECTWNPAKKA